MGSGRNAEHCSAGCRVEQCYFTRSNARAPHHLEINFGNGRRNVKTRSAIKRLLECEDLVFQKPITNASHGIQIFRTDRAELFAKATHMCVHRVAVDLMIVFPNVAQQLIA